MKYNNHNKPCSFRWPPFACVHKMYNCLKCIHNSLLHFFMHLTLNICAVHEHALRSLHIQNTLHLLVYCCWCFFFPSFFRLVFIPSSSYKSIFLSIPVFKLKNRKFKLKLKYNLFHLFVSLMLKHMCAWLDVVWWSLNLFCYSKIIWENIELCLFMCRKPFGWLRNISTRFIFNIAKKKNNFFVEIHIKNECFWNPTKSWFLPTILEKNRRDLFECRENEEKRLRKIRKIMRWEIAPSQHQIISSNNVYYRIFRFVLPLQSPFRMKY